jgi:hypothetical protein
MGSVISEVECPKCGYSDAYCEFYYKIGEEYIFCKECGYISTNGKADKAYGSYVIQQKKGVGQWGSFNRRVGRGTISKFKKTLKDNANNLNLSECYLNVWDEKTGKVVRVVTGTDIMERRKREN